MKLSIYGTPTEEETHLRLALMESTCEPGVIWVVAIDPTTGERHKSGTLAAIYPDGVVCACEDFNVGDQEQFEAKVGYHTS